MRRAMFALTIFGVSLLGSAASAVEIEWIPVSSTGSFTVTGNEITVPEAGVEIRLDLLVSGWDANLNGLPSLGVFEATLDPASYASGPGAPLAPLTTPDPSAGAFQELNRCLSLPDLIPTGRRCDPPLTCVAGEVCTENDEWILAGLANTARVSTFTLAYSWLGVSELPCVEDDGTKRYAGTLIVVVPPDAFGTYTIGFDPAPEKTGVDECLLQPLPNLILTPAKITIETGPCCLSDQCVMTSRFLCDASATGYWLQSFAQCPVEPICEVGSCCVGPGECRNDSTINKKETCEAAGGFYLGRVRCSRFPCPACDITDDAQCKSAGGASFFTSDAAVNQRVADDVRPTTARIERICWQGIYNAAADPERAISDCNTQYEDDFTLTVYADAGGFPDEGQGPISVQTLLPDKGPQSRFDRAEVFEYSASLSEAIEVTPGDCYWIQIQNDRGVQDGCYWQWAVSGEAHNLQSAHNSFAAWSPADLNVPHDMTLCLNAEMSQDDCGQVLGTCCTPPARCSDATLSECTDIGGVWQFGNSCDSFVCTRPTGVCCDLSQSQCTDEVEDVACARPLQWVEGSDCTEVDCEPTANIALAPAGSSGPSLITDAGDEIILADGGGTVDLEVRISGWDTDRNGVPRLGAFQATLNPAGYGSGTGAPLSPLSSPDRSAGAFQVTRICATVPELVPTGATCDPPNECPSGTLCLPRADWVFGSIPTINVVATAVPAYEWLSAIQSSFGASDKGGAEYGGTLRLVVPPDAAGTYTIGLLTGSERSFLRDVQAIAIPRVTLTPAKITIESGKCCFNMGNDPLGNEPPGCTAGVTRIECRALGGLTQFVPNALVCGSPPFDCAPPCLTIVSSNPPSGATDAGQPVNIDGSRPSGWQRIELFVEGEISPASALAVSLSKLGGQQPLPGIEAVTTGPGQRVVIKLDKPIEPQTYLQIGYACSDTRTRLAFLPGDVDGDGLVHALDVLWLIDALNGVRDLPAWSTDIDRDGRLLPLDLLREIDLLNGAGAFDVWLGRSLPGE